MSQSKFHTDWSFPNVPPELQLKIMKLQAKRCAKCGSEIGSETYNFYFITPPHLIPENDPIYNDLISEHNIVALCSSCYAPLVSNQTTISVKFIDDTKTIVDQAEALILGNGCYCLIESPRRHSIAKEGDVVNVTCTALPGSEGAKYYVFTRRVNESAQ